MKKLIKPILLILLFLFIVIQFFHPKKNIDSKNNFEKDISVLYPFPDSVKNILETSCYDCHSNNTTYPWYSKVQPVAWWLNDHIKEGKRGLNFNEFASYPIRKQYKRFADIIDEIKEGEMPLSSYTFIHTDAKLNEAQKNIIFNWANSIRDSIKNEYPADSLVKKPA